MKTKAVSKYNRISARKARVVADMVRGEKATNAFHVLKFTPKKAARLIEKTLKSAVANAENNFGADKKDLVISEIMIDEGPTLKRYRPRSRGMASSIMKRTSHVTIVVEGQERENKKKNTETKLKTNGKVKTEVKEKKELKDGS
ncbi:50S ribosomal protein L22 [candidate division WS5 bacterium]|uniref:Large ribosomal subunit protein uL22 n=1 Tax=candidate division WS5 bacterium TaxID=2093353 RepID=A0A419DAB0_9BACT|nr:MAG: 50S ribosomal protein L22 [candidate division WS5 bacterium]